MIQITNHTELARQRILKQYTDKPNFTGLVSVLGDAVQEVENAVFGFAAKTSIGTADGVWLEFLGAIIGETRDGSSDALYRKRINARILANRSSGSIDEILGVASAIIGSLALVTLTEYKPAAFQIKVDDQMTFSIADQLRKLLRCARSAGVAQMVRVQHTKDDFTFSLSTNGTMQNDPDTGFGDSADLSAGGQFSSEERA